MLYNPPPRSWAERAYNVVRWSEQPRGGHFAAMEEPDLFTAELRAWGREASCAMKWRPTPPWCKISQ